MSPATLAVQVVPVAQSASEPHASPQLAGGAHSAVHAS